MKTGEALAAETAELQLRGGTSRGWCSSPPWCTPTVTLKHASSGYKSQRRDGQKRKRKKNQGGERQRRKETREEKWQWGNTEETDRRGERQTNEKKTEGEAIETGGRRGKENANKNKRRKNKKKEEQGQQEGIKSGKSHRSQTKQEEPGVRRSTQQRKIRKKITTSPVESRSDFSFFLGRIRASHKKKKKNFKYYFKKVCDFL